MLLKKNIIKEYLSIEFLFFLYLIVFTSGLFYQIFVNNPLIWPVVFTSYSIYSLVYNKNITYALLQNKLIKYNFIFILLFFSAGTISLIYNDISIDYSEFIRYLIKIISSMVITVLFILKLLSNKNRLQLYFITFLYINFIFQIYSIINPSFFIEYINQLEETYRPAGIFVNPNHLSIFYLGVIIYSITTIKNIKLTILVWVPVILGTLLTFSRTGIIGVLLIVLVYFYKGTLFRRVLFFSLILILLFYGTQFIRNFEISERIFSFNMEVLSNSRIDIWFEAFNIVLNTNPFLGLGLFQADRMVDIGQGLGPHNLFIYIWASAGLFGVIYFAFLLSVNFLNIYRDKIASYYALVFIFVTVPFNHDLLFFPLFWLMFTTVFYCANYEKYSLYHKYDKLRRS